MSKQQNINQHQRIAPCGMNCGICMAYQRKKNASKSCRGSDANKPKSCVHCIIRNCELLNTADPSFCYTCQKYPCTRLKQLDKRYRTKYAMSMIENLEYIKSNGLDSFIQKEHNRWLCRSCGGYLCVHKNRCQNCAEKN